jgi:hypothetical protein
MSLSEAYYKALTFTGKVVVLTGITLGIAVATWAWSPIKFQADMGILLAFMFIWNMLGALILLPALGHFLLRPKAAVGTSEANVRQRRRGDAAQPGEHRGEKDGVTMLSQLSLHPRDLLALLSLAAARSPGHRCLRLAGRLVAGDGGVGVVPAARDWPARAAGRGGAGASARCSTTGNRWRVTPWHRSSACRRCCTTR